MGRLVAVSLRWSGLLRRGGGEKTSEFNRPDKLGDIVGARQIPSLSLAHSPPALSPFWCCVSTSLKM
jgi:hypothetical protein